MSFGFQSSFNPQYYVSAMRPVFNKRALYSDNTENYIYPVEPAPYGEVTVRFRAEKNNIDRVFVEWKGTSHLMEKTEETDLFEYYELVTSWSLLLITVNVRELSLKRPKAIRLNSPMIGFKEPVRSSGRDL